MLFFAGVAMGLALIIIFGSWCYGLKEAINKGFGLVIVIGMPLTILVYQGWATRDFGVFLWTLATAVAVNLLLYLVTGREKTKTLGGAAICLKEWLPRQALFSPVLTVAAQAAVWFGSGLLSFIANWFRLG